MSDGLSGKTKKNILRLFDYFGFDQYFGRTEVMETFSLTASPASALIGKMLDSNLIIPISGHGKGKYIFTNHVCPYQDKMIPDKYREYGLLNSSKEKGRL